jgi:hypothetical protein
LVAYDMEQGVWSQIQAPMPHAFDYHALVECQGRIFTIGGQLKNDITKRICILQLERTKLEWVEVSTRGIKFKPRVYPHMYLLFTFGSFHTCYLHTITTLLTQNDCSTVIRYSPGNVRWRY